MLYHTRQTITATFPDGKQLATYINHGVRAVSRKHALNKSLNAAYVTPAYMDRASEGIPVGIEIELIEGKYYPTAEMTIEI